jgi:hypothetical protein
VAAGCGMQFGSHLTPQARERIAAADRVLYLVDPVAALGLTKLNSSAESLGWLYSSDRPREQIYEEMVEHILGFVRAGEDVCLVSYGHPGVFADPFHESIRRARCEGFPAEMLPAISSEDCLCADLLIDPATSGRQTFDATDFLVHRRRFDPTSALVLLQVALTGQTGLNADDGRRGARVLFDVLAQTYGETHEVILYEAAIHAIAEPSIHRVALRDAAARISKGTTLFVPPLKQPPADRAMLKRLGLMPASRPAQGRRSARGK